MLYWLDRLFTCLLGTAGLLRWYLLVARSQKIAGEKPVGGGRSFKTNRRLQVGVTLVQGCDYVNAKICTFIAIRLPKSDE